MPEQSTNRTHSTMLTKESKDKKPNPDSESSSRRAEFDRAMNTSSPNPRYGGLTPVEAIRRMANPKPKNEAK